MKKNRHIKSIVLLLIVIIIIFGFLSLCFFRNDIYKACVPNVEVVSIGPMFIGEKRYDITVPNDYIYKNDNDIDYVLLAKNHSTVWYISNYCFIAEICIIAKSDTHSAIEFIESDYNNSNKIIISDKDSLKHGQDVYIVNDPY